MSLGGPDFTIKGKEPEKVEYFDSSEVSELLKQEISFDHGRFVKTDGSLTIGIFDSGFLFVIGELSLLKEIAANFATSECTFGEDFISRTRFPYQ